MIRIRRKIQFTLTPCFCRASAIASDDTTPHITLITAIPRRALLNKILHLQQSLDHRCSHPALSRERPPCLTPEYSPKGMPIIHVQRTQHSCVLQATHACMSCRIQSKQLVSVIRVARLPAVSIGTSESRHSIILASPLVQ